MNRRIENLGKGRRPAGGGTPRGQVATRGGPRERPLRRRRADSHRAPTASEMRPELAPQELVKMLHPVFERRLV
ncbi:MAG: hypothetical protein ACREYB_11935, partial [Casimicrobiaceae bacterium]